MQMENFSVSDNDFLQTIFHCFNLNDDDYKFGKDKVFFKAGKFYEFDNLMKSNPENLKSIVVKAQKYLITLKLREKLKPLMDIASQLIYNPENVINEINKLNNNIQESIDRIKVKHFNT